MPRRATPGGGCGTIFVKRAHVTGNLGRAGGYPRGRGFGEGVRENVCGRGNPPVAIGSIHRPTLCELIGRRLRDRRTCELVALLLDRGSAVYREPLAIEALNLRADPLPPEAGLPIGSYLSQWSGALYLDGLDHFVKRELKISAYLRFMDDFTAFSNDAHELVDAREAIAAWLHEKRRLALNPKRWQDLPAAQPSTFLAYRVSRGGVMPGRKLKRRMRRRIRALREQGPVPLTRNMRSYRGSMTFG